MSCPLPSQRPMTEAVLFFGRNIAEDGMVSEAQWSKFAATTLKATFPDGFTVIDGAGSWRDPDTGEAAREPSKIVIVALADSAALASGLQTAMSAYRAEFHQKAVGVVTRKVCAAF